MPRPSRRIHTCVLLALLSQVLLCGQGAPVEGAWEGVLQAPGGGRLRLRVHVEKTAGGGWKAALDSPDQGAFGIAADTASFEGGVLRWTIEKLRASYEGRLNAGGTAIEGTFTQGVAMELVLKRMPAAAAKAPGRPQLPKGPFPYRAEEVTFSSTDSGVTLAGTLTVPAGAGPHPAVILISGSGPQDRDETIMGHKPFLVLADWLTRRGVAVLRYDDRGTAKSTGAFAEATSVDFSNDAEGALDYLKGRKEIDGKRIGFLGHSEGGLVAPMVAVRRPEVAFVVLLAGTAVPGSAVMLAQGEAIGKAAGAPEAALAQNRRLQETLFEAVRTTPDPEELRKKAEEALSMMPEAQRAAQVKQITGPWMRFFITYDPAVILRRLKAPVLALFGELDLQVLPEQNAPVLEAALRAAGNEQVEIHRLAGLNHLFQPAKTGTPQEYATIEQTMDERALELIAGWLRRTAGLEQAP